MTTKTEIMECIELNKATIKDAKKNMVQLDRVLSFIEEYREEFGGMDGVGIEFHRAIAYQTQRMEKATELLNKRKKQLKLLEQLEAMEEE